MELQNGTHYRMTSGKTWYYENGTIFNVGDPSATLAEYTEVTRWLLEQLGQEESRKVRVVTLAQSRWDVPPAKTPVPMTKSEAQAHVVQGLLDKAQSIMLAKRHDYATTEDIFSNFRRAGTIIGWAIEGDVPSEYVDCLALIGTKIARLIELLGGKEPKNEAIEDTCVDLANYAIILAAMWLTRKPTEGE